MPGLIRMQTAGIDSPPPTVRAWLALTLVGAVMLVLVVAGVAKCLDLAQFASQVRSYTLLPPWLTALSPLVPAAEIAVGGAWLLKLERRRTVWCAFSLLIMFTLIVAAHWAFAKAPECACFGKILAYKGLVADARGTVLKNIGLLCMLLVGWFSGRSVFSSHGPTNAISK